MKSKENRSARAEETTTVNDSVKSAEKKAKKKDKNKDKLSPKAEKELSDANTAKAAKDEVTERHTKYIYPAEVKSTQDKKDFRRKARAKIAEFTKAINKLKKKPEDAKELHKKEKEYAAWKEAHLNPVESV